MSHRYLVEVGLEDLPANVIDDAIEQFKNKTAHFLQENKISYKQISQFSTPRRLALLVEDIAEKQADLKVEAKGPALKIAKDESGNWTKAALGFARKNQVEPDDLSSITIKNQEYLYLKQEIPGKKTVEILPEVKNILTSLTFKTRMRWANHSFEYIRPLHWIVSLFDDQVVPFEILGIKAGRTTWGHRFLGQEVTLKTATDYESSLKQEFVIANQSLRKTMILNQIQQISTQNHFNTQIDQELLKEVVNIVEYPTAFMGTFADKYLMLPDAVLITSMKDNQRYFYVTDANGKLLPRFVAVRNGNAEHLTRVIKGNEKVLAARLDDALFFYEEDQKHPIRDYVAQLKYVSFHDDLGNLYEKMARSKEIALLLGKKLKLTKQEMVDLAAAGEIYDFDLQTEMVGEFAELQGVMGEIYAKLAGLNNQIAAAIFEHYLPISAHGKLPETTVGAVLAVADKVDTLLSFFSINQIPNGSNDPYALRRQTTGIVRILIERHWDLSLTKLFKELENAPQTLVNPPGLQKHLAAVEEFIRDRIDQQLTEQKLAPDIIQCTHRIPDLNPAKIVEMAELLAQRRHDDNFVTTVQNLARIQRLFKKEKIAEYLDVPVDSQLFSNKSEQSLAEKTVIIEKSWIESKNIKKLYSDLEQLVPTIVDYFDQTMINDQDAQLRKNRYRQMATLANLINNFGDLTQLVI